MITLYGIKQCDTVKKARRWLDARQANYRFHDYREDGLSRELLERFVQALGWESMLNRKSTTWRSLADCDRSAPDRDKALNLMLQCPALIKRPILETGAGLLLGFDPERYEAAITESQA